jgi:hypothetical protein
MKQKQGETPKPTFISSTPFALKREVDRGLQAIAEMRRERR